MQDYEERLRLALVKQHNAYFDYERKALKTEYSEYIDCPVCDSKSNRVFLEKDWFRLCKCNECTMVYLNPRLNEHATHAFYNSEWTFLYNERKFGLDGGEISESIVLDERHNLNNLELIKRLLGNKRGDMLEIGPGGRGGILRAAKEMGFRVYAVEIGEDNVRSLRKILGREAVYGKELAQVHFDSNTFDVVYMRDVLEHVLNPRLLLVEINRILKKDGILNVEVPNIEGAIYKLVRENHVVIFGFAHVNYWSPYTLKRILERTGFRLINARHRTDDLRICQIAAYYLRQLPFTSVRRRRVGLVNRLLLGGLGIAVARTPLKQFDDLLPRLADLIKRGSVLSVVARKC